MTDSQMGFGFESGHDEARARDNEVDPTPAPVVAQGLSTYRDRLGSRCRPLRHSLLDPCAGSGVFGQQGRLLLGSHVVGIEKRSEEAEWLRRNYDAHRIGDALDIVPTLGSFHLAATNPAFSLLAKLLPLLLRAVRAGGHVLLFGLNEWGTRGEESAELWKRYPPREQWRVGRTIRFRRGENPKTGKPWGADMRSYSWWVWESDGRGNARPFLDAAPGRLTLELPELEPELRRWEVFPGRESPAEVYRG